MCLTEVRRLVGHRGETSLGTERMGVLAMARVTVMIPSYNYAQFLTECVESAAAQDGADVVIVDNGSTDGSPEIGERLAALHANVRFVCHERNDGIITSFNRCRSEIRSEYAMLLCADDMLTPGSLARSIEFLDAHPDVGLVYGTAVDFSDTTDPRLARLPDAVEGVVVHEGAAWIDRLCASGRNPIRNPEAVMRSSVAASAGPFEEDCPYTSDLNLWLRLAARSNVGYLRGPVQAMFRQHGANAGKAYPHNSPAELEQRWTAFERFFATLDDDPRRRRWETSARATLGRHARYSASRVYQRGDLDEVSTLLDLAERIDPGGASAIEGASWALRERLGPTASRWFPGFQVRPAVHRLRRIDADRRRERVGLG